jgi:hypothetical protein
VKIVVARDSNADEERLAVVYERHGPRLTGDGRRRRGLHAGARARGGPADVCAARRQQARAACVLPFTGPLARCRRPAGEAMAAAPRGGGGGDEPVTADGISGQPVTAAASSPPDAQERDDDADRRLRPDLHLRGQRARRSTGAEQQQRERVANTPPSADAHARANIAAACGGERADRHEVVGVEGVPQPEDGGENEQSPDSGAASSGSLRSRSTCSAGSYWELI